MYRKKWDIGPTERIATAGSCFAQHIGRHMKRKGFNVLDMEPPPYSLSEHEAMKFGFSTYSARYGNIYTARQLLQLAQEAFGLRSPEDALWQDDTGSWFDAMRPGVEPEGLTSREEVVEHRAYHLSKVKTLLESMDMIVFTLGLTETWVHKVSGTVYPTAPGTIAGRYDPEIHAFKNFTYEEVVSDFLEFRKLVKSRNNLKCKYLLTVSPVPLTATATDSHVMLATVYSKSVLRAAAGYLSNHYDDIDYFPSYEIITNPWSESMFYGSNLRSVTERGVDLVMQTFFSVHPSHPSVGSTSDQANGNDLPESDVVCEDAILDAFARQAQ
jgi:hypothetical protein